MQSTFRSGPVKRLGHKYVNDLNHMSAGYPPKSAIQYPTGLFSRDFSGTNLLSATGKAACTIFSCGGIASQSGKINAGLTNHVHPRQAEQRLNLQCQVYFKVSG